MTAIASNVSLSDRLEPDRAPSSFERHAAAALQGLQKAIADLIASIPAGGQIRRATDLQRVLGVRSTLAWQVFRVATSANPIEEGRGVPGPTAMERFLEAAIKRGVPDGRI